MSSSSTCSPPTIYANLPVTVSNFTAIANPGVDDTNSVVATMVSTSAAYGTYRLCIRMASTSAYGDSGVSITIASFTAITPSTVLMYNTTVPISLIGTGLDVSPTVGAIRSVRFEYSSTCTTSLASANPLFTVPVGDITAQLLYTQIIIPLGTNGNSGLPPGAWQLCLDWRPSTTSPTFSRPISSRVFVGLFVFFFHTSAFSLVSHKYE